ncbi:hypothetical protein EJB05_00298, partial [Eragrostis curvula]
MWGCAGRPPNRLRRLPRSASGSPSRLRLATVDPCASTSPSRVRLAVASPSRIRLVLDEVLLKLDMESLVTQLVMCCHKCFANAILHPVVLSQDWCPASKFCNESCAVQMLVWDEPKTKYHPHICYDMIYTVPVTPNIHVHIRNVDLWLHLHSDTAVSSCRSFSRIKKRQCCMPTGQETLHGGGTWTAPELCSPPASPKPGCSSSSGVTRRRPALCSPPAPGPVHAEAVAERPPSPSGRRRRMQDDGATADGE